jgi:NADPH:quinone reductase-like Zn-dependent oxidoreductase
MSDKMMRALFRVAPGKMELREVPRPVPKSGQVLVKVAYSPINPSDFLFVQGIY